MKIMKGMKLIIRYLVIHSNEVNCQGTRYARTLTYNYRVSV